MNTQLIIPDEIKRELSVNPDGTCVISIRGLARLLEIAYDTLYNHFKADRLKPSKLAETLTQCGFNLTDYSTTGIDEVSIAIIINYYTEHGRKKETRKRALQ